MKLEQRDLEILKIHGDTIEKKQYLGNRNLINAVVPSEVRIIKDWAFSYCKNLEIIWLPKKLEKLEQHVFDGCNRLKMIYIYENPFQEFSVSDVHYYKKEAGILAFAVCHFFHDVPEGRLLEFSNFPEPVWYQWYDSRLKEYIDEPEEKGFLPFLAGGEEDYEEPDNTIEAYCEKRQQEKVEGIFLRLLTEEVLQQEEAFLSYIKKHQEAVIRVLINMREEGIKILPLLLKYHILTADNIDVYLSAFEGSLFTECRAYLLHKKEELKKDKENEVWNQFQI